VNQNGFKSLEFNLSGIGFWLTAFAIIWLLGAVGLGWLVKSFLILMGLILLTPVIAFLGFRWWLKRNLVEDACPVCRYESAGINGMQLRCPNCGEPLKVESKHFHRMTPPGTVDVDAIDVSVKQLED
jgi:ssDNA-binding Zn-finger/Zn-ribbon topoisomerase 1